MPALRVKRLEPATSLHAQWIVFLQIGVRGQVVTRLAEEEAKLEAERSQLHQLTVDKHATQHKRHKPATLRAARLTV
jgi:hypothetical protein